MIPSLVSMAHDALWRTLGNELNSHISQWSSVDFYLTEEKKEQTQRCWSTVNAVLAYVQSMRLKSDRSQIYQRIASSIKQILFEGEIAVESIPASDSSVVNPERAVDVAALLRRVRLSVGHLVGSLRPAYELNEPLYDPQEARRNRLIYTHTRTLLLLGEVKTGVMTGFYGDKLRKMAEESAPAFYYWIILAVLVHALLEKKSIEILPEGGNPDPKDLLETLKTERSFSPLSQEESDELERLVETASDEFQEASDVLGGVMPCSKEQVQEERRFYWRVARELLKAAEARAENHWYLDRPSWVLELDALGAEVYCYGGQQHRYFSLLMEHEPTAMERWLSALMLSYEMGEGLEAWDDYTRELEISSSEEWRKPWLYQGCLTLFKWVLRQENIDMERVTRIFALLERIVSSSDRMHVLLMGIYLVEWVKDPEAELLLLFKFFSSIKKCMYPKFVFSWEELWENYGGEWLSLIFSAAQRLESSSPPCEGAPPTEVKKAKPSPPEVRLGEPLEMALRAWLHFLECYLVDRSGPPITEVELYATGKQFLLEIVGTTSHRPNYVNLLLQLFEEMHRSPPPWVH